MNGYNKEIKPSVHVRHSFSVISCSNCFLIAYRPISVISYVRMVPLVGRLLAPTPKTVQCQPAGVCAEDRRNMGQELWLSG